MQEQPKKEGGKTPKAGTIKRALGIIWGRKKSPLDVGPPMEEHSFITISSMILKPFDPFLSLGI